VAGAAALLVQEHPKWTPLQIKSALMNTAETSVGLNPSACAGIGAPITRVGAGEVHVDRAANTTTGVWDADDLTPSLSFGYQALVKSQSFNKKVLVHNYGSRQRTYSITPKFRYPNDAASAAITFDVPSSLKVDANESKPFTFKIQVDVTKLPIWALNGGSRGGDGFRLQDFEFDGFIGISDGTDSINVPWHILPHRSAHVTLDEEDVHLSGGTGDVTLENNGAVDGRLDVFSLTGTDKKIPKKDLPQPGDNFAIIDLKSVGARMVDLGGGQFGMQFALNTYGVRSHPNYPAELDILIDVNRDGTDDYVIFNTENGGFAATGQNVVVAGPLPNGPFRAFFFTDADLDSANAILTAPMSAIGLTPTTTFNFSVIAFDNYFTGNATDAITGMTYTPATPRFVGSGVPVTGVPAGGKSTLTINAVTGGDTASPSQDGLLLLYRDPSANRQADTIIIEKD
jgi:hypothetical protein